MIKFLTEISLLYDPSGPLQSYTYTLSHHRVSSTTAKEALSFNVQLFTLPLTILVTPRRILSQQEVSILKKKAQTCQPHSACDLAIAVTGISTFYTCKRTRLSSV